MDRAVAKSLPTQDNKHTEVKHTRLYIPRLGFKSKILVSDR